MGENNKRKNFKTSNKYQKQIIALAFLPTFMICVVVSFLFIMFYNDMSAVILNSAPAASTQFINNTGQFILMIVWLLFVFILCRAYAISRNMVGAFDRIMKELDEVIAGNKKGEIIAREKDELANELLSRINVLIKGYNKQ